jgi:hypothetical protein
VHIRLTPQVVKGREELLVHILLKSAQGEVPELHEGQVIVGPVDRVLQSVAYFHEKKDITLGPPDTQESKRCEQGGNM